MYSELLEKLKDKKIKNILIDEKMKNHTTFKVGGPADLIIIPRNQRELIESVRIVREEGIPLLILGNGSNLLVRDGGIRGVVIKTNEFLNKIEVKGSSLICESGALLSTASRVALKNSLTGLEFASGIPGAFGGAVTMNAGAYGGEMKDIVKRVKVIDNNNKIINLYKDELDLEYRNSIIKKEKLIILEVEISLELGKYEEIEGTMSELRKRRNSKQPLEWPSGGSTFKRPKGYYAGKLIDDSGLRGLRYKDAQVSEKHCGFIINRGNASCNDILQLIKTVRKVVKDNFGVELEREIMLIGDE